MTAMLDIVNSVIIAGLIVLMVLGVHLMTMKSATENQVYQQMQGLADATLAVLQEEIRFLHSFISDNLEINTNSLYFRDTFGNIVHLVITDDMLGVSKSGIINTIIKDGPVDSYNIATGGLTLMDPPPSIPAGSFIRVINADESQTRMIESFEYPVVFIRGNWDVEPQTGHHYEIYYSNTISEQTYQLSIVDRSIFGSFAFNMVKLAPDGTDVAVGGTTIPAKDVDMIRVNITIRNNPEQLYADNTDQYRIDLQKDFYLRGFRLPSAGG